jgi:Ca2+-binding EF-hand superfamily protein
MMHLDPVFDVLDVNHNGTLSTEEIQAASVHLLVLDKNQDGVIRVDEMTMRQQSPAQRTAHIFGEFDTNHDGKLSREEAPDGLRTRFDDADKNHDGFLDQSELEQMFGSMPPSGFGRRPEGNSENNGTQGAQPKGPNN